MDPTQRERVSDDLRGLLRGELLFDELSRSLYSTDASVFRVEPLGVVTPADEEDVQKLVRYAAEHLIALVPRGAGTGVAGESLGAGLVVDLSRHFRQVLEVGPDTVRVQPGVVLEPLQRRLAQAGRRFAPDPASASACTVGGMLATDASGARAVRHGYTRDHAAPVRAVLDSGDAVALDRRLPRPLPEGAPDRLREIASGAVWLAARYGEAIRTGGPRTPFDRCGYRLDGMAPSPESVDLLVPLVGSEGTLALFTEATLRTVPLPGGRSAVLLGFERLTDALKAARLSAALRPSACELLDRRG